MKTIKGPGIFLAQFAGDAAPFNTLASMAPVSYTHLDVYKRQSS